VRGRGLIDATIVGLVRVSQKMGGVRGLRKGRSVRAMGHPKAGLTESEGRRPNPRQDEQAPME
jgi:hypothetical protein